MSLESLNGRALSWAELKATFNVTGGQTVDAIDIKSIDHETAVKQGEQRGAGGGRVRKRTTGELTNSASATFYRDGLRDFKRVLMDVAPKNADDEVQLSKVRFDLVIVFSFEDDSDIHQIELLGCQLLKDSGKHAEGSDVETVDVDLNPLRIVEVIDGVRTVLL